MITVFLILGILILMALFGFEFPKVVEKIEDVPDKYRPHYAKGTDGKFTLDEELATRVDNSGLVSALDKERKAKKDFEKREAAWKKLGLGDSPEDALKALQEAMGGSGDDDGEEDDGDGDASPKDKSKRRLAKMKTDHQAAIEALKKESDGKLQTMQSVLRKHLIEGEAVKAVAAAGGEPDLLLPHVREKCLLVEEDGHYVVRVVDAEGDPRTNARGEFMTVADLVEELRKSPVFGRAFAADQKSGSGTRSTTGNGGGGSGKPLTSIEKISRGLAKQRR
jgi:hypothetical protein